MNRNDIPSYWEYLRLPELLDLQQGLEEDEQELSSDELHFIVVHQVFELWFKLVLRELRLSRDEMAKERVDEEAIPFVVHHLRRVSAILRLCADQFSIMETLIPQDFLEFRDKLMPSSGFQSFQMRELEMLLGLDEAQRLEAGYGNPIEVIRKQGGEGKAAQLARAHITAAETEATLRDTLHGWLRRTPIQGSRPGDAGDAEVVERFVQEQLERSAAHARTAHERLVEIGVLPSEAAEERIRATQAAATRFLRAEDEESDRRADVMRIRAALLFIESYRELPLLAWPRLLIDTVVELEERLVLFRSHHVRMVERVIGRRTGTGGSSGVDYLERTTQFRIFPELWNIRTLLLPKQMVPPVQNQESYEFRSE